MAVLCMRGDHDQHFVFGIIRGPHQGRLACSKKTMIAKIELTDHRGRYEAKNVSKEDGRNF